MSAADRRIRICSSSTTTQRLRALLQKYLTSNGFRVSAAADAEEARTLMKSMAFDLLILDVMMPGEIGLDLTRAVRVAIAGARS